MPRLATRKRFVRGCGLVAAVTAVLATGSFAPVRPLRAEEEPPDPLDKYHDRIDESIDRGLEYLAGKQNKDGSFECPMHGNTAVTSLCVMAFLAKGYTPETEPYGELLNRAIDYVVSTQDRNGLLVAPRGKSHGPMYSHCISTLMLSEISGMVSEERQERVDEALGKALRLILDAQNRKKHRAHAGGWRYQPTSNDSDISCTGWALMALRSARNNGAPVPKEAIDRAVEYLMILRHEKTGGFQYQPGKGPGLARTGTGLLCLELCGKHGTPETIEAGKYCLKEAPRKFGGNHYYYALYYCSQGMFQLGGEFWTRWAERMYELVLSTQREDGSWPAEPGSGRRAGQTYATAMSVLAMSVSYRQLPIYQR